MQEEMDTSKIGEHPSFLRGLPNDITGVNLGGGQQKIPISCPIYIRIYRRSDTTERHNPPVLHSTEVLTWTTEIDHFTFGVKVLTKIDKKKRTLSVFVQDENEAPVKVWSCQLEE